MDFSGFGIERQEVGESASDVDRDIQVLQATLPRLLDRNVGAAGSLGEVVDFLRQNCPKFFRGGRDRFHAQRGPLLSNIGPLQKASDRLVKLRYNSWRGLSRR